MDLVGEIIEVAEALVLKELDQPAGTDPVGSDDGAEVTDDHLWDPAITRDDLDQHGVLNTALEESGGGDSDTFGVDIARDDVAGVSPNVGDVGDRAQKGSHPTAVEDGG
jgi:hypothetical protein